MLKKSRRIYNFIIHTLDSVVLLPKILAFIGFLDGLVTSLAVIMTFWLGPLGPSVPSLTATPKD